MTEIMLDIETLGTEPGAAIISIGAVAFDREDGITDEFFRSVSLADCQAHGLEIDAETLSWWLNQPAQAREQLHGGLDLESSLRKLTAFVEGADAVWANSPAFDCVLLRDAYDAVGLSCPWRYYVERDYRTVREEWPSWPDREQESTEHDGLADARYQAECLLDAMDGVASDE
jgi:DNA polymerase III epsilon subunit-like protein